MKKITKWISEEFTGIIPKDIRKETPRKNAEVFSGRISQEVHG